MISEVILNILAPKSENDFVIIKTISNYYELRMGGYKLIKELDEKHYNSIDKADWVNKKVKRILSDDYILYIENEDGSGFSYGFTSISGNGESALELSYENQEDFKKVISEILMDDSFCEIAIGN